MAVNTIYENTFTVPISTLRSFAVGVWKVTGTAFCTDAFLSPSVTEAYLGWNSAFPDARYELRYRQTNSPNWTTLSSLTALTMSLTGLTGNTNYEWQIRWYYSYTPAVFEVRWRAVGSPDWTLIATITKSNFDKAPGLPSGDLYSFTVTVALSGLTPSTQYEWQVRTVCGPVDISPFSSSIPFQTLPPCLSMYTLKNGMWNDYSVWSCNRIPTGTDDVQIKHIITVPANIVGNVRSIRYDIGHKLIFGTNARLKLGY